EKCHKPLFRPAAAASAGVKAWPRPSACARMPPFRPPLAPRFGSKQRSLALRLHRLAAFGSKGTALLWRQSSKATSGFAGESDRLPEVDAAPEQLGSAEPVPIPRATCPLWVSASHGCVLVIASAGPIPGKPAPKAGRRIRCLAH